ncbi:MAG TPA: helix-turn-helix domain-containing protein [Actinocatenispora sp.]
MPTGTPPDWAGWEVAVPRRRHRLPGVTMAGFRQRVPAFVDITMVPHPSVTLFVDLGSGLGTIRQAGGRRVRRSFVAGLLPGVLQAAGSGAECLQIRLAPVVARAVLGASAELTGSVVPLADIWGRDAERAEDRLRSAASWDERFAVAAGLIGRRLATRPPVDPEVAHSWRRMAAGHGRVRVESLAGEVGWSRKRLWSRCRSQLGITPKRAAELVRFDHAAHLLAAGHPAASVAAASGYVDQSHLHREARAFAGLTPTAVAAAPWLSIDDVAWPVRG